MPVPRSEKRMATRGTGGMDDAPAHQLEVLPETECPIRADGEPQGFRGTGGWGSDCPGG